MPKTKVLLADDHAIVTEGLAALLRDSFDLVGVVHDGYELLDAAESLAPDVIITDISMPRLNGIDAIRKIRARLPEAKIVVLKHASRLAIGGGSATRWSFRVCS